MIKANALNAYNCNNIDDLKYLIAQLLQIISELQQKVANLENKIAI